MKYTFILFMLTNLYANVKQDMFGFYQNKKYKKVSTLGFNNFDLTTYKMPSTDNVLSKIFEFYTALEKHKPKIFYLFTDPKNKKLTYKLYLNNDYKTRKIVIEAYYDTMAFKASHILVRSKIWIK